ncbi:hypothetical protein NL676_022221 [Syzygium grande]|nr:hypothetical protein NL676_022221 [Syzygium grande]
MRLIPEPILIDKTITTPPQPSQNSNLSHANHSFAIVKTPNTAFRFASYRNAERRIPGNTRKDDTTGSCIARKIQLNRQITPRTEETSQQPNPAETYSPGKKEKKREKTESESPQWTAETKPEKPAKDQTACSPFRPSSI